MTLVQADFCDEVELGWVMIYIVFSPYDLTNFLHFLGALSFYKKSDLHFFSSSTVTSYDFI